MDIPVDNQVVPLAHILSFSRQHAPEGLGKVVGELLRGHRVKSKSIQEAVEIAFKDADDREGNLADFLHSIIPRGDAAPWGWSRIGWSWQQWWKLTTTVLTSLNSNAAFDSLASLLDRIE